MNFDTNGLLEPQVAHTLRLLESLDKNNIAADLSPVGTGKTYCAAAIARHHSNPTIVIAPKLVLPTWNKVLGMYGVKPYLMINYELLCRGNTKWLKYRKKKDVERWLTGHLKFPQNSIVYLDESHRTKGISTLSAGLLIKLKEQNYKMVLMSATAATNPLDMRSFGYATNLIPNVDMKTFKTFCENSGCSWLGKWGVQIFDGNDPKAQAKMKMVHENLFNVQKIASKMNRVDFGDIFPDNQIVAESYDMGEEGGKIKDIYEEMETELIRLEERCENYRDHIFSIIVAARRKIELLKTKAIVEMVQDLYDEGKSVVVFLNYTDSIEAVSKRLSKQFKGQIGYIYGEQNYKDRLQDIEDFQSDKKRIILANIAAGAESISLHDLNGNFPRATIINPTYSIIKTLQSMGRVWRAYGKSPSYQRFLYCAGSIEDSVCSKLQQKKNNVDILNDGDLCPSGPIFRFAKGMNV